MNEPQFFQIVTARNTNKDGTVKDPNLMRRMRNPICRACQDRYRQKFPDQPFQIYCDGVPDEPDFQEMSQKTGLSYEQTRDIMDKQYWAERHTYLTDDRGDVKPFKARDYQIPMLRCTARRKVDQEREVQASGEGTGIEIHGREVFARADHEGRAVGRGQQ